MRDDESDQVVEAESGLEPTAEPPQSTADDQPPASSDVAATTAAHDDVAAAASDPGPPADASSSGSQQPVDERCPVCGRRLFDGRCGYDGFEPPSRVAR